MDGRDRTHGGPARATFSLLRLSALTRLAGAALLCAALWAAALWALH